MIETVNENYEQFATLLTKIGDLNREVGVIKAHQDSFSRRLDDLESHFSKKLDELCSLCKKNDELINELLQKNHLSSTLLGWLAKNWIQVGILIGLVFLEVIYKNIPFTLTG